MQASSQARDPPRPEGRPPRNSARGKSGNRAREPRGPAGGRGAERNGASGNSGNRARESETWSGDLCDGQDYTPFPANLPTFEGGCMREESAWVRWERASGISQPQARVLSAPRRETPIVSAALYQKSVRPIRETPTSYVLRLCCCRGRDFVGDLANTCLQLGIS